MKTTRYERRDRRLNRQADIISVAILAAILICAAWFVSGCKTSPERTAHNVTATTITTANAAIKTWFGYVQSEERRLAALKTSDPGAWMDGRRELLKKEGQVASVWDSYVSAMRVVVLGATELQPDKVPDTARVEKLRAELINLVTQLIK